MRVPTYIYNIMLPTCIRAYLRVCACGLIPRAQVCTKKKPNPAHIIRRVYNIIIICTEIGTYSKNLITTCDRRGCSGYATAAVNAHLVSRNDIPDSCYDIKETVLIYCCLFIIII